MSDTTIDSFISEQPLEEEDRKLLETAYNRLVVFEQANRIYHDEARGAREVYRLRDPQQDAPRSDNVEYYAPDVTDDESETVEVSNQNRDKKTLQLHTLKSTITNCIADQMLAMPQAKLLPETPDKQNVSDALQDALNHIIYEVNHFERLHRRRVEDFFVTGSALMEIGWDDTASFGEGDVSLVRWPIEAFCWDPKAEDLQEARALIKVSWHPLSWYRAHYPENGRYVQGEDHLYNNVGMPSTQQANHNQEDEDQAMLMEYWYRTFDGQKYHINVAHIAGHALLQHKTDVFKHGMYPFVIDTHFVVDGQPIGEGLVGALVPMMRYINRYAKYMDTNARLSAKARLLKSTSANIKDADFMDWEKDVIPGDSIRKGIDWDWLTNPPFNGMIAQQMLNMQAQLKQDSGASQVTRGESVGSQVSGKAYSLLMQAGSKVGQANSVFLNDGFAQMTWQVLCLVSEFYDNDRLRKITGKDETFEFFGDDMTVPRYTVQVEVQQKDPARIQAQNQMFIDMYTMSAQAQQYFPVSVLIQLMNLDGKDKILPVILDMEQKGDKIRQLSEQNTQLIETIAQLQKETDALRYAQTESVGALASMGRSAQVNQGRQAVVGGMGGPR
jgi:hypothetical protein